MYTLFGVYNLLLIDIDIGEIDYSIWISIMNYYIAELFIVFLLLLLWNNNNNITSN